MFSRPAHILEPDTGAAAEIGRLRSESDRADRRPAAARAEGSFMSWYSAGILQKAGQRTAARPFCVRMRRLSCETAENVLSCIPMKGGAAVMAEDRFVFRNIEFAPDPALLRGGVFYRGEADSPAALRLLERCRAAARPKAVAACAEVVHDGAGHVVAVGRESMSGPVLDGQLGKVHRAFAFVATCGTELASVDYEGDEELRRALLTVCMGALQAAQARLTEELTARYHLGKTAVLNPGSLPEWPLAEQDKLFRILGDVTGDTGVTLGEDHFMAPLVSSSGLLFETEQDYQNCMYCTNLGCAIRRAPYDPEKAAALRGGK